MNTTEIKMETKDILNDLKRQHNLTNGKIADYVGVTETAVSYWMNGQVPKFENMEKLAELFGVSVSYLYGDTPAISVEEQKDVFKQIDDLKSEIDKKNELIADINNERLKQDLQINSLMHTQNLIVFTVIMIIGYLIVIFASFYFKNDYTKVGRIEFSIALICGIFLISFAIIMIVLTKYSKKKIKEKIVLLSRENDR